jgi:uncharacterized metal-binding protein
MLDIHTLRTRPLVYSCSGCSDAAQTANYYALKLTQEERAEMSCIAGVGGGVTALVKQAQSGRIIWAELFKMRWMRDALRESLFSKSVRQAR